MDIGLLKDLIPYVVPAVLAFITVVLGPAFITTRRVRQDLASDTELLGRLQPDSKEHTELGEAVQSRTLHLVSMIHYPAITRLDVLAWLGVVACSAGSVAWWVLMNQPSLRPFLLTDFLTAPMPLALVPPAAMSAWVGFQQSWSRRAVSRVRYVRRHLGLDEALETLRSMRLAEKASYYVAIVLVACTIVALTAAALSSPDVLRWSVIAFALFVAAFLGFGFVRTRQGHGLENVLPALLEADFAAEAERAADAERAAQVERATAGRHSGMWRRLSASLLTMGVIGRRRGQERGAPGPSSRS